MKKLLHCLIFCCAIPLFAQSSFQKSLPINMDSTMIRSAPDGQSVYVAGITKQNSFNRIYILRLDGQGNILWQQTLSNNNTVELKGIVASSDGVVVLISDNQNALKANGFLMKMNTSGTLVWSKRIDTKDRTQVFDIEQDGAENIWLSGLHLPPANNPDSAFYFLMQFKPNGSVAFVRKNTHHYFINTLEEVYKVINLAWHPANSTLSMIEDFSVPYNQSGIIAFNRKQASIGYCDADKVSSELLYSFQFSNRATTKNVTLVSGWTTKVPYFDKDLPAIGLMDSLGQEFKIIKTTQHLQLAIHTNSNDIVFYEPIEKTLTKYDRALNPIWTKKYDNCFETSKFAADVAVDGSIYTVRNIKNITTVSRILPTGALPACKDYDKPPIPIKIYGDMYPVTNVYPSGFYNFPFSEADSLLSFAFETGVSKDYCVKLDALFDIPDTVCIGASVKPTNIDTASDLRHTWFYLSETSEKMQPTINFISIGTYKIVHSVENTICQDTTSRYIKVLLPPKINLNDTVVCGAAKLSINLTDANTSHYYLNGVETSPKFDITQRLFYRKNNQG
jgi:hypothetical protein